MKAFNMNDYHHAKLFNVLAFQIRSTIRLFKNLKNTSEPKELLPVQNVKFHSFILCIEKSEMLQIFLKCLCDFYSVTGTVKPNQFLMVTHITIVGFYLSVDFFIFFFSSVSYGVLLFFHFSQTSVIKTFKPVLNSL